MNMLTRAAAAMWHERADEPLQVGQFKEPSDYRSYSDLGAPAQGKLLRYTRAALLAALDPQDDALVSAIGEPY